MSFNATSRAQNGGAFFKMHEPLNTRHKVRILTWAVALVLTGIAISAAVVLLAYKKGHISIAAHAPPPVLIERQSSVIATGVLSAYYPLNFSQIALPYEDSFGRGGAMFTSDTATFHIDRAGQIYRVGPDGLSELDITPPFDMKTITDQADRLFAKWVEGIKGAQLVRTDRGWRLFVTYLEAQTPAPCFRIILTSRTFQDPGLTSGADKGWNQLFASDTCTSSGETLTAGAVGGALMVRGSKAYVSYGPVGQSVNEPPAISTIAEATAKNFPGGTIAEVDVDTGETQIFAQGFRNVSGIIDGNGGTLWSLEHGPRGGDELNHVERSHHYGWPLTTMGTQYTGFSWRDSEAVGEQADFRAPVYAWVPSIAPSALRRIKGRQFPRWSGNLVVSALKAGRLYRLQIEAGRVVVVEPILIGRRIRDFVEGPDGALYLLLTRAGVVLKITAGKNDAGLKGAAALNLCASCHQLTAKDSASVSGPTLVGIVNRDIASVKGYPYSEALAQVKGEWTEATLEKFLENPEVYGTGSTMPNPHLSYSQRRLVIKGLLALDRAEN
jgi:cytochrome c2